MPLVSGSKLKASVILLLSHHRHDFVLMFFKLTMAYRGSMSYLHIAEKNSIAKEVASILSDGSRRTTTTLSKFNPVFLFERDGRNHTFSSVRGHIFEY
jgi:hypothetical protein